VKEAIEKIKTDLTKKGVKVKSQSDVVAICITAYDIMYGSTFGESFTAAVNKALSEVTKQ
jgi:glucosamine 6-phosphate synthetase-like amidotransferase/phosphosugar isomerase protein